MTLSDLSSPYRTLVAEHRAALKSQRQALAAVDQLIEEHGPSGIRVHVDDRSRLWVTGPEGAAWFLYSALWGLVSPEDRALERVSRGDWVVTPDGRVLDARSGRRLGSPNSHGYIKVAVHLPGAGSRAVSVHRIVHQHFHGPIPPGLTVDHIDGDRLNNAIENLRLLTAADNTREAWKRRRSARTGEDPAAA